MYETDADKESARQLEWALLHAQDRAARARLDLDAARMRSWNTEQRLRLVESSVSFRLGAAIVGALKSWRKLPALFSVLVAICRNPRSAPGDRVDGPPRTMPPPQEGLRLTHLLEERRTPASHLSELRVAAVLDEFSYATFAPDCDLVNLPVDGFESILDEFAPHLLLVESAWRGLRDEWRHRICPASADLRYLVDCCRRRGIPTVFWNKEDPAHFDDFIEAASLFDNVLTTDSDCIGRYVQQLGHDRVGTLAFCCQPRLHHPVEAAEREAAACFAGSWYRFYPERSKQFDMLVGAVLKVMPVVIFDRNSDRGDPDFAFPERYAPLIKSALPYSQIGRAYKGYGYAITVNSVRHSPTMLARRVYELLACNTIVVSNRTESLSRNFAELVVIGEAADEIESELRGLSDSRMARHRLRLRGLREVLSNHTAAHRLDVIAGMALGVRYAPPQANIVVAARARNIAQAETLLEAFGRQTWERRHFYLILPAGVTVPETEIPPETVTFLEDSGHPNPATVSSDSWLALFHPDDYYGPDYLTDLGLATLYAPRTAIGKGRFLQRCADGSLQSSGDLVYRHHARLWRRAMIAPWPAMEPRLLGILLSEMESEKAPMSEGLAIDEFSYCREGANAPVSEVDVLPSCVTAKLPAGVNWERYETG